MLCHNKSGSPLAEPDKVLPLFTLLNFLINLFFHPRFSRKVNSINRYFNTLCVCFSVLNEHGRDCEQLKAYILKVTLAGNQTNDNNIGYILILCIYIIR